MARHFCTFFTISVSQTKYCCFFSKLFLSIYFIYKWIGVNTDIHHSPTSQSFMHKHKQTLLRQLCQSCKVKEQHGKNCIFNLIQIFFSKYTGMRTCIPSNAVPRSQAPGSSCSSMADVWAQPQCCVMRGLQLDCENGRCF